jgi:hypothetical protein
MLRDDLACTLRALTGDLQGEVRQLLRRQPQRTGAEVAARAAIGVRIFQHIREGRHRANSSIARPLPPRLALRSYAPESGRAERHSLRRLGRSAALSRQILRGGNEIPLPFA